MAMVEIVMPKMGESIMEATILRWRKKPGDFVQQDEPLMDIATDKVDSEVPSTAEGVLEEVMFQENDVVPVGAVVARIRTTAAEPAAASAPDPEPETSQPLPSASIPSTVPGTEDSYEIPYQPTSMAVTATNGMRFYSPLVINIASQEGISMSELERIPGTGADGRVTKKDILSYVQHRGNGASVQGHTASASSNGTHQAVAAQPSPGRPSPAVPQTPHTTAYGSGVEVIEMDRMRKLIAEHMVRSKSTSAHVTSFAEADVTHMVQWREKVKSAFEKKEGEKITYTPILIEAIVRCLRKYPMLNASVDGDRILIKKDIHIGMATALPNGNLIVPVIHSADQLNLVGLVRKVNRLANHAREGLLKPEETQGGSFTFTNVGSFGSLMGTPIINQPQVAILAAGAIKKRPVVIESAEGDSIGIRHMMILSMSYDHRIIDGAMGARFLSDLVKDLESFDVEKTV